jgi:hypothetical protein
VRVLVTGSRKFGDSQMVYNRLERLWTKRLLENDLVIVHGACPTGADALADAWAVGQGVTVVRYPADWSLGRSAGYIRNIYMITQGPYDLCLAFFANGAANRGTAHCAALAEQKEIPVERFSGEQYEWPVPRIYVGL